MRRWASRYAVPILSRGMHAHVHGPQSGASMGGWLPLLRQPLKRLCRKIRRTEVLCCGGVGWWCGVR